MFSFEANFVIFDRDVIALLDENASLDTSIAIICRKVIALLDECV